MTDRELLELAAKAADVKDYGIDGFFDPTRREWWNPLTDDGDALRLAVKLRIDLQIYLGGITAVWIDEEISETHEIKEYCDAEFEGEDAKYVATRRAIVRAAAAIGKQLQS